MRLPEPVHNALQQGTCSVLIDTAQLAAVRNRFDAEQTASLARYLEQSQSANTLRAYRSDWLAWAAWCVAEKRQALPADGVDVAVYLAACADTKRPNTDSWAFSPATVERKAAAIAAVHAANGFASPTRSDVVRLTLRGIRRVRSAKPVRKRPVLLGTLEELLNGRPEDGWPGGVARRRDALLLLMGFAGALRRSELAQVTLDAVSVHTDPQTMEPLLLVDLGITKTDQTGTGRQQVALPRGQRPHTCPVCAFVEWTELLSVHDLQGHDGLREWLNAQRAQTQPVVHRCHTYAAPEDINTTRRALFPSVSRYGRLGATAMTDRAIADLIKRYAQRAGLNPALFSGHSLRAGFATQAALGGATDREIMRQGRWASPQTVHRYIRTANPLEDNAVTKLGL